MARIIIFGDLHANFEALIALQQAESSPKAILCLGDIIGYGPDPKLCLDMVRPNTTHIIGGRHDQAVGSGRVRISDQEAVGDDLKPADPKAQNIKWGDLLESSWGHARSVLPAEDRDYLTALPSEITTEIGGTRFHLTRLIPDDTNIETHMLITMSQTRLKELFGHIEADVILLGGPHIPAMRQVGKQLIVCPGSLGQPRYGVADPTFAAWEDGRLQIHHLHYDPQTTVDKMTLLPLGPEHTLRLQNILQTGGLE